LNLQAVDAGGNITRHSGKGAGAISLLAGLILLSGCAYSANVVLEGQTVMVGGYVTATAEAAAESGEAEVFDRQFPLFHVRGETLRAILPVPLGTKPGFHKIRFKIGDQVVTRMLRVLGTPEKPLRRLSGLAVDEEKAQTLRKERDVLVPLLRMASHSALWSGPLRPPLEGVISSPFGVRRRYDGGAKWVHRGVDYAAPSGCPVVAPAAGDVLLAKRMDAYGNTVLLDHGQTVLTVYMHMKSLCVQKGERAEQGQVIGLVGQTGLALGSHLHFGVFIHGVAVDPEGFLKHGLP